MSNIEETNDHLERESVDSIDPPAEPLEDESQVDSRNGAEWTSDPGHATATTGDQSGVQLPVTRRSAVTAGALGLLGLGLASNSAAARPLGGNRGRAIIWQKNQDANGYWLENLGALTTEVNPTPVVDFEGSNLAIDTAGHLGVSPELEARVAELEDRMDESDAIHQTIIDFIETNAGTVNSIASMLETSFNDTILPTIENGFNSMTDTVVTFINETLIEEFLFGIVIEEIISLIEGTLNTYPEQIEFFHETGFIPLVKAFNTLSNSVESEFNSTLNSYESDFNFLSNTVESAINQLSNTAVPGENNYLFPPVDLPTVDLPTIDLPMVPVPDPLRLGRLEIDRPTPPELSDVPDLSIPRLSLPRVNETVTLPES